MARTITKTLYTFDELSDSAKERARDRYRLGGDVWGWHNEWWASAQTFSAIAPVCIREADYDREQVDITWTGDDDVATLSGVRAWKWLQNNGWFAWGAKARIGDCPMTGFCGDSAFGDPLAEYERHPSRIIELQQVFYEMVQAWVHDAAADMRSSYEDEQVDEAIEINEYEFDEAGNRAG